MVKGNLVTDEDGKITFNAVPGIFKVSINGNYEIIHVEDNDTFY